MKIEETPLPGVLVITPDRYDDERGFFMESWNARSFADAGLSHDFVQDNHSRSAAGVLRGLHYQQETPQGKLVRVTRGRIFDVAADIRYGSPTFGQWHGIELSGDDPAMFYIPEGFAHGFYTLDGPADLLYKCTTFYDGEHDRSLAWNDPQLAIDWPLNGDKPKLSAKDAAAPTLADIYPDD